MWTLRTTAAALALLAHGCSIVTVKGAPDVLEPQRPPDCTTSKAAVYGDGIISGAALGTALLLGIAALGKEAGGGSDRNDLAYATLYTFLGGLGFSVSGVIGGFKVRGCRDAHEQWRRQFQPMGPAPMPYPPPGTYPAPYPPPAPAPTSGPPGANL